MGVLPCSRKGCDSIMCQYSSNEYGYLCRDCYEELLSKCDEMTVECFLCTDKHAPQTMMSQSEIEDAFANRYED